MSRRTEVETSPPTHKCEVSFGDYARLVDNVYAILDVLEEVNVVLAKIVLEIRPNMTKNDRNTLTKIILEGVGK